MDSNINKWIRWLKIIENEVTNLLVKKDIFWKVNKIIKNNKTIQKPSYFYDYLGQTYIAYALIGVRRQVKIDKTSISLARLLSEIIENPTRISREYYKSLYNGPVAEQFPELADKDFDRLAGIGQKCMPKEVVGKDLITLKQSAKECEDFADKRLAHRDTRKLKYLATFKNIDDCIDTLDKLCVKYNAIFHATSPTTSLMPTLQDWTEIFRYPWLS